MKILIASARFPYQQGKADSMTVFYLIQYLARRNHEVILATFNNWEKFPESERELMRSYCKEVRVIDLNKMGKMWRMGTNVFGRAPYQVAYYRRKLMQQYLEEMVEEHQPDVLYAHLIRMAEYIKPFKSVPKILAMQIAQTLNYGRLIQHEKDWLRKIFYTQEFHRVAAYEPEMIKHFDRILLISPHDEKAIVEKGRSKKIFFNPHGIDVDYFSEDLRISRKPNVLVMNGDFGVPTNMDGALHFYHHIYPLIKKEKPDTELWLVGRNPAPSIRALTKDPLVKVTGKVPDIRPFLQEATIGIAPMRVGAGLQNKVLVSLASQLPVVATPIANEGIIAPEGDVILTAKGDAEFAQDVIDLLNNPNRRKQLGGNALEFMQQRWTWDFHFRKLEEMMAQLVLDRERPVENYYPFQEAFIASGQ